MIDKPTTGKHLAFPKRVTCGAVLIGAVLAAPMASPALAALAACETTAQAHSSSANSTPSSDSSVTQSPSSVNSGNNPCSVTADTDARSGGGDSGDSGTGGGGGTSGLAAGGGGDGGSGGGAPPVAVKAAGSGGDGGGNGGNGGGGGFAGGSGFMSGATSDAPAQTISGWSRGTHGVVAGGGGGTASGLPEANSAAGEGVLELSAISLAAPPPGSAQFCLDPACGSDSIKRVSASFPIPGDESTGNSPDNAQLWIALTGLVAMLMLKLGFKARGRGKLWAESSRKL